MNIPSEKECLEIMARHDMLENIIKHSMQVRNVSLTLVDNMNDPTIINRDLVIASALLHDIAKTRTIATKELRHDLIGGKMLRDMGYSVLAPIVESHVFFNDFDPHGALEERELVYYADKRVMHDRIVSIEERIQDLVERYGFNDNTKKLIRDNKEFIESMELKIQGYLKSDIESILAML